MPSPAHRSHNGHRAATLPWPARAQRRWPTMWRLAFVALVAALSFVLAGPATTASAAPPPFQPSAADSPSDKPSFWKRATDWVNSTYIKYAVEGALDPHDDAYVRQSIMQIGIKRVVTQMTKGWPSWKELPLALLEDANELKRRKAKTLEGRTKQVTEAQDRIREARKSVAEAKTPKAREQAEEELRSARRHYKKAAAELRDIKATQPEDIPARTKDLDKKIHKLQDKAARLERQKEKQSTPRGRKRVQQQIDGVRERHHQAEQERKQLKEDRDDDGDADGTPAKRGPKTPTQGPGSTSAKTPMTPTVSTANPSPQAGINSTKIPPKAPTLTGMKPQKLPVGPGIRSARGAVLEQIGELAGQAVREEMSRANQKVFEESVNDPAMAQRLVNEYKERKAMNPVEQIGRPFTGREFTEGELLVNGPKLIEVQKTHDRATAKARKSNADPLYQQARKECGGYDTCVTERTRKLREKNAKDIAESDKKARRSNADPLYQQARKECGGYDTCVTERTRKLREKNAKDIAESDKKARRSNADPLYQQARKECGGYDTCVTERTRKLREKNAKDT
ncbi:hypothetical protein ABZY34_04820, partial [Streptomyces virginiae]|uniref:hypothetical protein n=1 Tax=Streptomyces virginiae TaxID=1961 RepID=UPI0033B07B80